MALPKTELEFEEFIAAFESGRLIKQDWHHAEHVAVATWYLLLLPEDEAIQAIAKGIQNLNRHHGVEQTPTSGYHETWTIFFSKILGRYLAQLGHASKTDKMNQAINYLRDFKSITFEYYSRDLIMSSDARIKWHEPDLKTL
jgi:hypothetical protein